MIENESEMTVQFLALATRKMEVEFPVLGKARKNRAQF